MNSELIAMLDYLERERSIKREVLVEAISSALLTASKKNFTSGTRELRIDIDPKSGAIRALAKLIAVERVQNPHDEILISKARALKPGIQAGEEIEVEVTPRDFGRIAAQAARQAINPTYPPDRKGHDLRGVQGSGRRDRQWNRPPL